METLILGVIVAACSGAFAAALGAVGAIALTAVVAIIGVAHEPGTAGTVDFLGIYAFGLYLGPHVSFAPAVAASAYAGARGYVSEDGKDIITALIGTGRVSPILVGGGFGALAYLLRTGFAVVMPHFDTIALTVVVICLLGKLFGTRRFGELVGTVSDEVAAQGGRFARRCTTLWLPWQGQVEQFVTIAVAVGGLSGWIAWLMMGNPATAGLAIIPGWAIGLLCFFFFPVGLKIPVTHHMAMVAGLFVVGAYPFNPGPMVILWGVAGSVVSGYLAEYLSRVFTVYGHGFVDPPSMAIFCGTVIVWALSLVGAMANPFIIPGLVLLASVVHSVINAQANAKDAALADATARPVEVI